MRISGVINTLNEERHIANAIGSLLPWVNEIIVVDMHSDDRTVEIARGLGAQVFLHERIAAFDGARQFAVEQAGGDWIMLLDADELVTAALAARLRDIAKADSADVVNIPRRNYMLGAWIEHAGWGPEQDRQRRFFRKQAMIFSSTLHAFSSPLAGARLLDLPYMPDQTIVHFNYDTIFHFFEKMNRYTSVEAAQALQRGETRGVFRTIKIMLWTFWQRYIARRGYQDGWRGLVLSASMVVYQFLISAKLYEMGTAGTAVEVESKYAAIATSVLDGFDAAKFPPG